MSASKSSQTDFNNISRSKASLLQTHSPSLEPIKKFSDTTVKPPPPRHVGLGAGKTWTYLMCLPFWPLQSRDMWLFMNCGLALCLTLYNFMPNKATIKPSFLTLTDRFVIGLNLFLTSLTAYFYIENAASTGHLINISSPAEIPPREILFFVFWILMDEILFFFLHRYAHKKHVYNSFWYSHKMHHKFLVTSAWTSFYAHPLDHLIAVLGAALITPLVWLHCGVDITVPTLTAFMFGAIITFTGSHHSIVSPTEGKGACGTDHLVHHQRFTVNYGNFGLFDYWAGSYNGQKFPSNIQLWWKAYCENSKYAS